jgi:hypothetical protein|tara:strand:- start:461 stop:778 length:318 start_codon:yes stop_codon:yes gene_type:complete
MTTKRKSIQTITDPLLEPFFITKDEYSFTVKQNVTSDSSHFRSKGKAKTYEKSLFFYADFARALEKIAQVKAEMGNFDSLEEYIENYKSISINIKNYTDGIRGAI